MLRKKRLRRQTTSEGLPERLLPFPNKDKDFHEHWFPGRDLANFPHPFRMISSGPPGSGKSTGIKNIIVRADPPFQLIVLVSPDPDFSKEYSDIEHISETECPPPEAFPGHIKTLVIMEDLGYGLMNKKQCYNVDRLFGYASTHKNISVMLACQDPIECPKSARRTSNVFVLARSPDVSATARMAQRAGMTTKKLQELFSCCKQPYDAAWVDLTPGTPAPLRLNCYIVQDEGCKTAEPNRNATTQGQKREKAKRQR